MSKKWIVTICMLTVACLTSPLFTNATDLDLTTFSATALHFTYNGNNFKWKLFFKDVKKVSEHVVLNGVSKSCDRQIRGYYFNPARWLRVRPIDNDSLSYLKSIDSSYNGLSLSGGLFICDDLSIYGSVVHQWKFNKYYLIAWVNYDFLNNSYLPSFLQSMLFVNWLSLWYAFDSYGGIASLFGAGLILDATCGNGVVEGSEICDQGSHNGQPWACNVSCNGIVPLNSTAWGAWWWGWWGGWAAAEEPHTPVEIPFASGLQIISGLRLETGTTMWPISGQAIITKSPYGSELTTAYLFAYNIGITTQWPITRADLQGTLSRKHAAKMISQFAIKIMKKEANPMVLCKFKDTDKEDAEMQYYMDLACRLWIMGLESDGTPGKVFNPNTTVTRAQFGTMLSRLLYGNTYNKPAKWGDYYSPHLNALKTNTIMNNISKPWNSELRGNVMIMMQRVATSK